MKYLLNIILFILFTYFPFNALAHSGMTNYDGCHMNNSVWPAQYHCHQKKSNNIFQTKYCLNVNFNKYCGYAQSTCYALQRKHGGYCSIDW